MTLTWIILKNSSSPRLSNTVEWTNSLIRKLLKQILIFLKDKTEITQFIFNNRDCEYMFSNFIHTYIICYVKMCKYMKRKGRNDKYAVNCNFQLSLLLTIIIILFMPPYCSTLMYRKNSYCLLIHMTIPYICNKL